LAPKSGELDSRQANKPRCGQFSRGFARMTQASKEPVESEEQGAGGETLHFVVGKDRSGLWVVSETHGLYGGIFCSKDAALRFARFEIADRPGDCAVTSDRIEFDAPRRTRR
jgi:hypothetical protein